MTGQTEITGPADIPPEDGVFGQWGFARRMVFRYHRNKVRCRPFGLKEWDFYQALGGDWVLQLTIGHVSYAASFSAKLFNLKSGEQCAAACMKALPLRGLPMEENPETPHVLEADAGGWNMRFAVEQTRRVLSVSGHDKKSGPLAIEIVLDNSPANEKMVIATPFAASGQFYLNYKENYWTARGRAAIGELAVEFGPGANALLDWGRGVWPFRHQWFWGNGTGMAGGKKFGFNIGWGFGDTSAATENMFFWQGRAYKLGTLKVEIPARYTGDWHFVSEDGSFDFTMKSIFDNYTQTDLLFVHNRCHQVFGEFSGTAVLPDGEKITVEKLTAFCEHAENQW